MSSQNQFNASTEFPNENEPTNEETTNNTIQGASEPSNSAEFDSQNTTNEPEEENRTQLNEPPTYGQPLRQYHTWNQPNMYPPTIIYYNPCGNCQMPGYSPCVHCLRNRVSMNPIIFGGHIPFSIGQLSTTVAQVPQLQQIGVYQQVPVQGVQVERHDEVSKNNQVPVQYQMPVHQQMTENNQAPVRQQAAEQNQVPEEQNQVPVGHQAAEQNQAPEHSQVPVLHQAAEQNQAPEHSQVVTHNQVGVQNQVLENSQARAQTQIAVHSQSPVHNQEPENSQVRIHQVPVNSGISPQTQIIKIIVEPSGAFYTGKEPREAAKRRSTSGDAVEKNKERETEERNQNDFEPIMIKIHFEHEEDTDSNKNKETEERLSNMRKENEKNKGPIESVGVIKEEPVEENGQEIVNIFDSRERDEPAKKSRKLNEGRKCDNVTGDSARVNLQRPSSTRATQTEFRNAPGHSNTSTDKPGPSIARATQTEPRDPPTNQPGLSSARAAQTDPRDARATQTDPRDAHATQTGFSNTPENQPGPSNAPGNQPGGSNGSMAGGGRNLSETLKPYQRKEIQKWSVLDVYDFIKDTPGCEDCAKTFFIHGIDGEVLVFLTIDTMMNVLNIKLGSAIKLVAKIQSMKTLTESEDDSD